MEHTLCTEGFGIRLRPVQMNDAAFIVWLRNSEHAKGRLGDSAANATSQEAWLKAHFERAGDCYFIVETLSGIPLGTSGLYDERGTSAETGWWIIRPGVPAALPSLILAFDMAFQRLGLTELRATTVSTNSPVLSLNRKMGFQQTHVERAGRVIGGKPVDMVHFVLTPGDWAKARERLLPLAKLAENQVREWEQAEMKARGQEERRSQSF